MINPLRRRSCMPHEQTINSLRHDFDQLLNGGDAVQIVTLGKQTVGKLKAAIDALMGL
jgi:hypothetical protein